MLIEVIDGDMPQVDVKSQVDVEPDRQESYTMRVFLPLGRPYPTAILSHGQTRTMA